MDTPVAVALVACVPISITIGEKKDSVAARCADPRSRHCRPDPIVSPALTVPRQRFQRTTGDRLGRLDAFYSITIATVAQYLKVRFAERARIGLEGVCGSRTQQT